MAEVRPAEPHVRLEHVTKEFGGGVRAVDDISLSIPRGSFTTLLGPCLLYTSPSPRDS